MTFYPLSRTCQIPDLALYYEAVFGEITNGTFVEIGAYDGETFSNTSGLADLGWTGVYVDPIPSFTHACRERHRNNPGIRVLDYAVGETPGAIELHFANAYTTADPAQLAAYRADPDIAPLINGQTITVTQVTLDQILAETDIAPGFELLSIDVEGAEEGILKGFDLAGIRPRMMIIELSDLMPVAGVSPLTVESHRRVRAMVESAGYVALHTDSVNSVFVAT